MNVFPLRAKTITGEYYTFTVLDAPVHIGDGRVVLLGRKFSPILEQDSIVLSSDVGVSVGDVLTDETGREWTTYYNDGFVTRSDKEVRLLTDFKSYNIVRRSLVRSPKISFRYNNKPFGLAHVVGKYGRSLMVLNMKELLDIKQVRQDACVSVRGQRIFLGDRYWGSPVVLCYGRICIQNEFGAYDIFRKQYIIKGDF